MLDTFAGWYATTRLGAKFVTMLFEVSLTPNEVTTLSLVDAVDGESLTSILQTDDMLITGVTAYSEPGSMRISIVPDNDSSKKIQLITSAIPNKVVISPPKLTQVSLVIDCINSGQPNDLLIVLSAVRIPQNNLPEFTLVAEMCPVLLPRIASEVLLIRKLLQNVQAIQEGDDPIWDIPKEADWQKQEQGQEDYRIRVTPGGNTSAKSYCRVR